jgi:hypothetical protein
MRKFARSIGSEGKSHGQQGMASDLPSAAALRLTVLGFGLALSSSDGFGGWAATMSEAVGIPSRLPVAPWGGVSRGVVPKDCQLRTAYGGESNCIIKT